MLAGFGLAGCETSSSLFGSNDQTPNPEPIIAKPAPAQQPALARVAIAPIIGAPDATARQIQEEFTSAVQRQRIAVAAAKEERVDYTLRGYIVAAKDKNATKVSYIWDVTDPTGKRVNRLTGEEVISGSASKDPWAAMSPAVVQSIAGKAANSFVAWVSSQQASQGAVATSEAATQPVGVGAQPTGPARAPVTTKSAAKQGPEASVGPATGSIERAGPVTTLVPLVTGAPGDGSRTLASAIQRELSQKGIALTDQPISGSYRVEGSVIMGPPQDGKQAIQIDWLVRDPLGKKLGTVSQKNEIPQGSLDGQWGKVADQAAGAAVQGIVKLLPQPRAIN